MAKTFLLEIVTPEKVYFLGQAESVIVLTNDGYEGFMAGHTYACKLLPEEGRVSFRAAGDKTFKKARLKGGFIEVKKEVTIYTDEIEDLIEN